MTNKITFEYPLNEKMRSYLRFEFLFLQLMRSKEFSHESDATVFFKALQIEVVDADIIARLVVQKGQPALTKIAEYFGSSILSDGELNRTNFVSLVVVVILIFLNIIFGCLKGKKSKVRMHLYG